MTAVVHQLAVSGNNNVQEFVALVGHRLRWARKQRKMSRRHLSERSGVSQRYLAQLESGSGNISIGLLYKICVALGYDPEVLLGSVDPWNDGYSEFRALYVNAGVEQQQAALNALRPSENLSEKKRRLCLLGLRGAGKSTLGRLLAAQLSLPFVELNQVIEEQSGIPVSEVIALYGQEGFRELEKSALASVIDDVNSVVLAVGGGIVSEPSTFSNLLQNFHTIWLKASPEEHMERVRLQGDSRPMAGNPKAMDELRSILTSRSSLYAQADSMLDTSGNSVEHSETELMSVVQSLNLNILGE